MEQTKNEDIQKPNRAAILDVYVAHIPETCDFKGVLPLARREEIESCASLSVRRQKYAVWKLLEYGLQQTFGY